LALRRRELLKASDVRLKALSAACGEQ